jgi:hypothetical protein
MTKRINGPVLKQSGQFPIIPLTEEVMDALCLGVRKQARPRWPAAKVDRAFPRARFPVSPRTGS